MDELTKEEFIARWVHGHLEKWLGNTPRSLESWFYSVEEWACMKQGELRHKEEKDASDA